ncbi:MULTISPECIES: pantoate--beta-alanine ligase [Rhodomicrobium]|uniref:pantoate--beta-alanine ligase n=1 Tax=Rhodomicrobium TaxID=1068 RepID=UPI000B4BE6FE|nr:MULTISPECIES: pantoate--beta-alanine ligase [Rhodomicrobium]
MAGKLPVVRTLPELRAAVRNWRGKGNTVALVPTMGALHAGHISLVHQARKRANRTVVSIFVNPTQFGPNEDFSAYPRDEQGDWMKLAEAKADLLYAPGVEQIYPDDFSTRVEVIGLTSGLEGASRPRHFAGVTTVVAKLFLQCLPDIAIFGEKDYQQLLVIRQLVKDLDMPIEVLSGTTLREADGLAMSSRNAYLDGAARALAPRFHAVLAEVAADLSEGRPVHEATFLGRDWLEGAGFKVDYLEVRDAANLMPVGQHVTVPARILGAVFLGRVRLIDNLPVAPVKTR